MVAAVPCSVVRNHASWSSVGSMQSPRHPVGNKGVPFLPGHCTCERECPGWSRVRFAARVSSALPSYALLMALIECCLQTLALATC